MNRKLHNSISALMAAGGALVLGLVVMMPVPNPALGSPAGMAALAADAPATRPLELDLGVVKAQIGFDRAFVERAKARSSDVVQVARRIEARAQQLESSTSAAGIAAFAGGLASEVADLSAVANTLEPTPAAESASNETKRKAGTAARRNRRNLVMPYFSFLSRG